MPPQFAERGVAERIVRQRADHARPVAQPGEGGDDIGFRAADPDVEGGCLQQKLAPGRREAQQDLAEGGGMDHRQTRATAGDAQRARSIRAAALGVRSRVKTPFRLSEPTRMMFCDVLKSANAQGWAPTTNGSVASTSR